METFNANKPTAPTRNNHPGTFIVRECIDQLPSIHVRNTPNNSPLKPLKGGQCQKVFKNRLEGESYLQGCTCLSIRYSDTV